MYLRLLWLIDVAAYLKTDSVGMRLWVRAQAPIRYSWLHVDVSIPDLQYSLSVTTRRRRERQQEASYSFHRCSSRIGLS